MKVMLNDTQLHGWEAVIVGTIIVGVVLAAFAVVSLVLAVLFPVIVAVLVIGAVAGTIRQLTNRH